MGSNVATYDEARLDIENVGGIKEASVSFSPGVTVLVGRNATNRTSLLQAVMAALGSENIAIKGDADEATVELQLGDKTYTRRLTRNANGIVSAGEPYLDDPLIADLFAFLLESNEARRAVANSENLRELIMRPVDTKAIEDEIERLRKRRQRLQNELEEIDELKGNLPGLEEERKRLENEIEEKKDELEKKENELSEADADIEKKREDKAELEDRLAELRSKRSDLDDIRYDIETERDNIESSKEKRQNLQDEQDDLPEMPMGEIDDLESRISHLRKQKQALESDVSELQTAISFNEERLDQGVANAFTDLTDEEGEDVTDQLLGDGAVTCWTCGTEVEREQIETTIDRLRELSKTKVSEVNDIEDEISELRDEKRSLERAQQERERISRQLSELDNEIDRSEERINQLQTRRETVMEEVETIEEAVQSLEEEDYSAVLDLHKEANQLEHELGRLENELENCIDDIAEIESKIGDQDELEEEIEQVAAAIEEQRTKIDRIEADAVDEFNEHMDTLLNLLDYPNIDRIWLERVQRETRKGRRKVTESVFEMHVIRTAESGTAYEDTVDHLSESEREVTGLVFALAGYFAHEVYNEVPFILLDSLEAIDSERISTLIEYFSEYAEYLLVALLPEDSSVLSEEHERLTTF